jgi:hypothetical protein
MQRIEQSERSNQDFPDGWFAVGDAASSETEPRVSAEVIEDRIHIQAIQRIQNAIDCVIAWVRR